MSHRAGRAGSQQNRSPPPGAASAGAWAAGQALRRSGRGGCAGGRLGSKRSLDCACLVGGSLAAEYQEWFGS